MNNNVVSIIANLMNYSSIINLEKIYNGMHIDYKTIFLENNIEYINIVNYIIPKWLLFDVSRLKLSNDELYLIKNNVYKFRYYNIYEDIDFTQFKNLRELTCFQKINPHTMEKLTQLNCLNISFTFTKYIAYSMVNLVELMCYFSHIEYIPDTCVHLKQLICSYTNVCEIPNTLINLIYLDCNNCKRLTTIPQTLTHLEILYVNSTNIEVIPETLTNLHVLNITKTNILHIPKTLTQLKTLYCNKNTYIDETQLIHIKHIRYEN